VTTSYITPTTRGSDGGGDSDHNPVTTTPLTTLHTVSTIVATTVAPDAPRTTIRVVTTLIGQVTTPVTVIVDETSTTLAEATEDPADSGNIGLDVVERGELNSKQEPDILSSPMFMPVSLAVGVFAAFLAVFLLKKPKKPAQAIEEIAQATAPKMQAPEPPKEKIIQTSEIPGKPPIGAPKDNVKK
jgi:hypothetical protein